MSRLATEQERRILIRAIRDRLQFGFTHSMLESRWTPERVYDPRRKTKRTFCGHEPWEFIRELLESGVSVEVIKLDIPKDADGWVIKTSSGRHMTKGIYLKLQLDDNGYVIGRSFHYDDPR
jgi:hypothetical protein